jgi:uncharacterized membrane protein YbaN (DUF454 family)
MLADPCLGRVRRGEGSLDRSRRLALKAAGFLSVGLGLLGAVLPLLPTTPFVLVASACFARSSPKLDAWLHEHEVLGPPLNAWEEHRALPRRAKVTAIAVLWISIPVSAYLVGHWPARVVLGLVLVVATALLARVPTLNQVDGGEANPGQA